MLVRKLFVANWQMLLPAVKIQVLPWPPPREREGLGKVEMFAALLTGVRITLVW